MFCTANGLTAYVKDKVSTPKYSFMGKGRLNAIQSV